MSNYLSSSSDIDTKFICILRNNSNLKSPVFYKCELKREKFDYKYNNDEYYYFQKKDELKGNILDNIKKINDELKEYENKYSYEERDINKYFYILELNIPLFYKNEEYGDFFELMDIPGLNEKDDFYLSKIIPFIVNKCLFSIYIFDMEKYENDDTINIYKEYSNQLNKFYNTNSIYILNKIDCIPEKDKKNNKNQNYYFDNFKKYLKDDLNVNLEQNYILKLNSKDLFNKVNAFSNFKIYFSHIVDTIEEEEKNELFNLLEYTKKKFIEYFQINEEEIEAIFNDTNENKYDNYYDENEYNEIMDDIISKGLSPDFEDNQYKKLKFIFKTRKPLYLPIPELNSLYKTIFGSLEKGINEFFNWNKVTELMKNFNEFINNSFEKEDEKNKYKQVCKTLLDAFHQELERREKLGSVEWNISILNPLKSIIDKLIKLDSNNGSLIKLKNDFNSLTYFVYNYRKIRIPLLGGYSTGKSSFLNSLIGMDILPVDVNKCTNRGIIIRHNKQNKPPQLFKTKFTHVDNPEYWYFKDGESPICEGYEKVKQKLIELNFEEVKFEDAFIVLKTPLKIFSEIDLLKNDLKELLEERLELIDFPGLDVKNNFYKESIFTPLMRFSDGFIFVNECDLIQESGNLNILKSILSQIKTRKFSFSYNSCLFLLHKLDKSLDLNIEKSKEIFKTIFVQDENFNVNKFSSKLFHIYLEFFNKYIKDFESFIVYILENLIKSESKKKIKNYGEFLNLINNISKKLKFQINKKFIENNNIAKEYDLKLQNDILFKVFKSLQLDINDNINIYNEEFYKIVQEIYFNYLYINDNHKFQNQRVLSNANNLFESLYKLFKDSYEYTENQFKKYFNLFIESFNDLFVLIDLKIYGDQINNQLIYNQIDKKNTELKEETNNRYKISLKLIKNERKNFEEKNQKIVDDFLLRYQNDSDENKQENYVRIEKKIQYNIKELSKKVNEQLNYFNDIVKALNMQNQSIKNIKIIYSDKILNKNSKDIESFEYKEGPLDIFRFLGNCAIFIHNKRKEKKKIEDNFNEYLKEINSLIQNCEDTYISEIESINTLILKKIDDNLSANNSEFEGIKKNRRDYEEIKTKYYNIINK